MNVRFETPFEQTEPSESAVCGTVTVEGDGGGGAEPDEPTTPDLPGDVSPVAAGGVVLALIIIALLVV